MIGNIRGIMGNIRETIGYIPGRLIPNSSVEYWLMVDIRPNRKYTGII